MLWKSRISEVPNFLADADSSTKIGPLPSTKGQKCLKFGPQGKNFFLQNTLRPNKATNLKFRDYINKTVLSKLKCSFSILKKYKYVHTNKSMKKTTQWKYLNISMNLAIGCSSYISLHDIVRKSPKFVYNSLKWAYMAFQKLATVWTKRNYEQDIEEQFWAIQFSCLQKQIYVPNRKKNIPYIRISLYLPIYPILSLGRITSSSISIWPKCGNYWTSHEYHWILFS